MSKPLRNKIAVVTGGTKGLGYIISSELAVLGAQVLIIYKNDHKNANKQIKKINKYSSKSKIFSLDLKNSHEVDDFIKKNLKNKKIDILVNNAGINKRQFMHDITENDWDNIMDTNLKSVFFFTKKNLAIN